LRFPVTVIKWLIRWKSRIGYRRFFKKWLARFAFNFASLLIFFFVPLLPAGNASERTPLWHQEGMFAYDGLLSADGQFLYFTLDHCYPRGIGRLNLSTKAVDYAYYHTGSQCAYFALAEDLNLIVLNQVYGNLPSDKDQLVKFSINPFRLVSIERSPFIQTLRTYYFNERFVTIAKHLQRGGVIISRDKNRITHDPQAVLRILFALSAEWAVPLGRTRPTMMWVGGEAGGVIYLLDLSEPPRVVKSKTAGFNTWGAACEDRRRRLWLSRSIRHSLDYRDSFTGGLLGSIRVRGIPRSIAIDEQADFLYVGLYSFPSIFRSCEHIAIIDLESLKVVRYLSAGPQVRRLLCDTKRRKLLSVSQEGIFEYDLAPRT
jgi:hypothetical protein